MGEVGAATAYNSNLWNVVLFVELYFYDYDCTMSDVTIKFIWTLIWFYLDTTSHLSLQTFSQVKTNLFRDAEAQQED